MKIVEIDDGLIATLAGRADALAAFPSLLTRVVSARKELSKATCASCAAKLRAHLNTQCANVKRAIVTMGPEQLKALKALLGADKVRVLSGVNHQGIPVRHTL